MTVECRGLQRSECARPPISPEVDESCRLRVRTPLCLLKGKGLMDSKVVARDIKREIWPLLRREGFTEFSPKTAWRHTPDQIHVVNYQSFNTYLA